MCATKEKVGFIMLEQLFKSMRKHSRLGLVDFPNELHGFNVLNRSAGLIRVRNLLWRSATAYPSLNPEAPHSEPKPS